MFVCGRHLPAEEQELAGGPRLALDLSRLPESERANGEALLAFFRRHGIYHREALAHRWPSQAARLCVIRSRLHRPTCRRGPSLPRCGIPGAASEARADARIEAGQAVLSEDPDRPARYPADLFRCYAPDLPDAVFTIPNQLVHTA
jgi:hypothetical protein